MLLSSVVIRLVINKRYLSKHCLSKQSSRTVSALKQLSKAIRNPHQHSRRISLRGMHLLPLPTTRLHTSKPSEQTEATNGWTTTGTYTTERKAQPVSGSSSMANVQFGPCQHRLASAGKAVMDPLRRCGVLVPGFEPGSKE